jgi:EamA domain-containing membrane protein RarD
MNKFIQIGWILIAGAVVAIADVIIKKIVFGGVDFKTALRDPKMLLVIGLYIIQIVIFLYLFSTKSYLSFVGIGQAVIYTIIVVTSGTLLFNEAISLIQAVGIVCAVIGVVLMNL